MPIYNRYKKLQKYYLGIPIDPYEFKKGDIVETGFFKNKEYCENNYNWKLVPNEYFCTIENDGTYSRYQKLQAYDKNTDMPIEPPMYITGDKIVGGCTEGECNGEPRYEETYKNSIFVNGWKIDIYSRKSSYDCGNTWQNENDVNYIDVTDNQEQSFDNDPFLLNDEVYEVCCEVNFEDSITFIGDDNELYFLDIKGRGHNFGKFLFSEKTYEIIKTLNDDEKEWFTTDRMIYGTSEGYRYLYQLHSSFSYIFNIAQPHYNSSTGVLTYIYHENTNNGDKIGIASFNMKDGTRSSEELKSFDGDISTGVSHYYYNGYFYIYIYDVKNKLPYYYKISEETHDMIEFTPSEGAIWYSTSEPNCAWYVDYLKSTIQIISDNTVYIYSMEDYQEIDRRTNIIDIDSTEIVNKLPLLTPTPSPALITDNIYAPFLSTIGADIFRLHAINCCNNNYYINEVLSQPIDQGTNYLFEFMGVKNNIALYRHDTCLCFIDLCKYINSENNPIEWRLSSDEYICDNGDKFEKLIKYIYNKDTGNYEESVPQVSMKGLIIQSDSEDCGVTWVKN